MENFKFYKKKSFQERQDTFQQIHANHPTHIPLIVETNQKDLDLKKNKFIVPGDIQASQFLYTIRKHLKHLNPNEALFLLVINENSNHTTLVTGAQTMEVIYDTYHAEDGFLYIQLSKENTFG